MARTVAEIQAQIIAEKNAQSDLAGLDSTSNRAIWRLWTFITATCIAILEQIMDLYQTNIEAVVARSAGASTLWVQDKLFKFQFDAADPQIIQLIDTVPQYPVVDATKRIITACSVTTDINNVVNIKVAKSSPYEALTTNEKNAAQAYINTIGAAGITYNVTSLDADRLYIDADIYYQGQYSAVISDSVIATLNEYMQNLSIVNFNGSLKMSDLEAVIRNVVGVNDVVLNNVRGRADSVVFAAGTDYILNTAIQNRLFSPVAGYMIQEDTATKTFADSLNFIAQ